MRFPAQFPIKFARPAVRVEVTVSQATLDFLAGRGAGLVLLPPGETMGRVLGAAKDANGTTVTVDLDASERAELDWAEYWLRRSGRGRHLSVKRGIAWRLVFAARSLRWSYAHWQLFRHVRFTEV